MPTEKKSRPRKIPAKVSVKVNSERRLLDTKIVPNENSQRLPRIILIALALGLVAGTALVLYWRNSGSQNPETAPQITLPEPENAATTTPTTTAETPPPDQAKPTQQIIISETPTGFVNVRTGPGTGYPKIGEVKPGESFELVRESQGWYEVKLSGGTGYIIKKYAKLK